MRILIFVVGAGVVAYVIGLGTYQLIELINRANRPIKENEHESEGD